MKVTKTVKVKTAIDLYFYVPMRTVFSTYRLLEQVGTMNVTQYNGDIIVLVFDA